MYPSNSIFTVSCTLPSFRNPGCVKYFYHIDGLEYAWHESTDGTFSYASLPAGTYHLIVQATIGEGIFSNQHTLFELVVHPPFHQTKWFWFLMIVLAGGAGYGIHRYRSRRVLEIERMRTRIASDLHDDIGATLSTISLLGDMERKVRTGDVAGADRLERIGELARHAVSSMSDIVWAVNPAKDTLDAVAERMESFLENVAPAASVNALFFCDEKLRGKILHAESRKTMLLIFKEAVSNALRHSGCSSIRVALHPEKHAAVLSIHDDGHGFDTTKEFAGNGLLNMRSRARSLGWKLVIESCKDGTLVELEFSV
jgi:signal transduction histidine kinase